MQGWDAPLAGALTRTERAPQRAVPPHATPAEPALTWTLAVAPAHLNAFGAR